MDSELDNILLNIAKAERIDQPKIVCTFETGKGDGYMGRIKMMEISAENQQKPKKLSVIVKMSPLGEEMHRRLPVSRVFNIEIAFYTKIAPVLNGFQSQYNANCIEFINCFYANTTPRKETLIIDNITPKGFTMLDRQVPMNEKQLNVAFEGLARFHALSFALKALKPEIFDEISQPLKDSVYFEIYRVMQFEAFIQKATENFRHLLAGTKYHKTFCDFSDRIVEELQKCSIQDENSVICHGDAWCNNIMFKHDSAGNPQSAILIDFQLSHVISPVADLSYMFYACANVALLPKLKDFLQVYHKTLSVCLEKFGLDVKQIYSWETLLEQWYSYGKLGFITSFLMRVVTISDPEESPDLCEAAKNDQPVMLAFYMKMRKEAEYNDALLAIIRHFIDEEYIY